MNIPQVEEKKRLIVCPTSVVRFRTNLRSTVDVYIEEDDEWVMDRPQRHVDYVYDYRIKNKPTNQYEKQAVEALIKYGWHSL